MTTKPLKLRAQDPEDVQVIAAVLQDAIVPVCDMMFDPAAGRFVMVAQRFRWDAAPDDGKKPEAGCFERICCALDITGVEAVQSQGMDLTEGGRMLDLLTLGVEAGWLHLIFAGDAKIRLRLGAWRLHVEDFGAAWPIPCQPQHRT